MPKICIIVDLGLGDAGKGSVVAYLTQQQHIKTVVRYNGGPQAAHNVVTSDGRHHVFAQFGSGTFSAGVETFLSSCMLVELENLRVENNYLAEAGIKDGWQRLTVDPQARIITPAHKMIGQLKEISRGRKRLGSCGMGVGEAAKEQKSRSALTVADCLDQNYLREKLAEHFESKLSEAKELVVQTITEKIRERFLYFLQRLDAKVLAESYQQIASSLHLAPSATYIRDVLATGGNIIFEGAQGSLLDFEHGFYPFVTKTRSTCHNALDLLKQTADLKEIKKNYGLEKIGVIRAYSHRHGPGPLVTENPGLEKYFRDQYNCQNQWQGKFRVGWLDLVAIRYGLVLNDGVDSLAMTNLDQLSGLKRIKVCVAYSYNGDLSQLDKFFTWESLGRNKAMIYAIKKASSEQIQTGTLARILLKCQPAKWVEIPGWQRDISQIRELGKLPRQARKYLDYLQGPGGLGTPLKIISVNATENGKILID